MVYLEKWGNKMKKLSIGMKIQLALAIVLLIMLIISCFYNKLINYSEIVAGITLLVMSYNNQKQYKRKAMTIIYAITGILIIAFGLFRIING